MTISTDHFIYINIGIAVFFIGMFITGYRKGIVRSLINIFGTAVGLWIACVVGPICAEYAHIWNDAWTPLKDTPMQETLSVFLNEIIWFLLMFIIVKIFFAFMEHFVKVLKNIPVLGTLSSVFGGILHMLTGIIWMMILCVILGLPCFTNGEEVIQGTWLNPVRSTVNAITRDTVQPWMESQAFDSLIHDAGQLQQEQRDTIKQWLKTHGYSQEAVEEVGQ